ncbi:MAG: DegT/DnrJ/EryC1/StrS aminotransferase family protein [Chloroflexi bacterium]|nr:DegT/DnrJ/EryC1/StrS aminotransferase family protein [Chloroflexota bacterium]
MRPDFLVFGAPLIGEEDIAEVVDTLRSGWLGTGPKVKRFEAAFKAYIGSEHAIAVNSCTAGLHLALDVLGIGPGDEVITTPITFAATANVIVHTGATPIFADIDRQTQNIDPHQVERAITSRTRAIIPVHMAGRPCDMDALMDIARRYHLSVIEDAAHATESWYKGRKIGTIGDITVFSFYVTKNICTGEGGMITTNRADWAEEMRLKSLHGISKDAWKRYSSADFQPYETEFPGYKYNMMDIQAALGIHQLARVTENLKIREHYWDIYNQELAGIPGIIRPNGLVETGSLHARHLYTLLLDTAQLSYTRHEFIQRLHERNIGTGIHFTALHLHKYYRERFNHRPGDFPDAEWVGERTVSLPLSPKLAIADLYDVVEAVRLALHT